MISRYRDRRVYWHSANEEEVGQPAEKDESCSWNGTYSEDEELGVVLCHLADGSVGEGRLVVVELGDVVDGY